MNSNRYFQELCRRAALHNLIVENPRESEAIYLSLNAEPLCHVTSDGACCYFPEHLDTEEKKEIYGQVEGISEEVKEYLLALEAAPPLHSVDLRDGYKLLCEHEKIVLAGKDMGEHSFQFVTWQYTYDRKGVTLGHYYQNDYPGAKEDFAVRSGLIDQHKLFEPEELKEIYHALDQLPNYLPDITYDQERKMVEIKEKLERIAPKVVEGYRAEFAERQEKVNDESPEGEKQQGGIEENQCPVLSMQSI
ncbi:MAG: hypothetical protein EOM59_06640 [Clostridia bacterium]|nr:hypothetical protein [Clostridia bacterium]